MDKLLQATSAGKSRLPICKGFFSRGACHCHRETCYRTMPLLSFPRIKPMSLRASSPISAVLEAKQTSTSVARIVALVGEDSISPLKEAPWEEVMTHMANKLEWIDEGYEMVVFNDKNLQSNDEMEQRIKDELEAANLLVVVSITRQKSVDWIQTNSRNIPNIICFDSSPTLENKLGGSFIKTEGTFFGKVTGILEGKDMDKPDEVVKTVSEAWKRNNSDDIRFCLLVIINAYIRPVPMLKNLRAKGLSALSCMVRNCGSEILNCLLDPNCRKALQCLNNCGPTDQVCSYRCIASYESPKFTEFSLCVLQKHNCLGLDAEIRKNPYVPPMSTFRGEAMTHEVAEDLFIGWLGTLDWSWRVIAGQNPAYDQFPCQYQLFYRGKANGSFWYEPVFKVRTFEGEMVWRRRRYRVKRDIIPGTFYFTVLDNGVVSREFWTIVEVADDLSWGLFHYSGAAPAAGQSYTGAVLVSPDGNYPDDHGRRRLASAVEKCGIKEWELYPVVNSTCIDPPLGIPEGSSLHKKIEINTRTTVINEI